MLKKTILLFFIAGAFIYSGCRKDKFPSSTVAVGTPGPDQVWMQNTRFTPSSITVSLNTTVTWTNKDNMDHNVTSNSNLFSSGNMGFGGTFSHQFTVTGTFPYSCTIHSGMNGVVVVQ